MDERENLVKKNRRIVAEFIFQILTGKATVADVLKKYPKNAEDKSLDAAWHAIVHIEADEELRAKDCEYKQLQDDYLELIASTLLQGGSLPQNIIDSYEDYYHNTLISKKHSAKDLWGILGKRLNV